MKYSCLVFGEGGTDKKFLIALIDLPKFRYHTNKWNFNYDSASGCSPRVILERCRRVTGSRVYDLVLCFVDIDKLKSDFPKTWEKQKNALEKEFSPIRIVWMMDKAEDEYRRVLGKLSCSRSRINSLARGQVEKFINSDFWHRILSLIREAEKRLENLRHG